MQNCLHKFDKITQKFLIIMLVQFNTSPPPSKKFFLRFHTSFFYLVSLPEGAPELREDEGEEAGP